MIAAVVDVDGNVLNIIVVDSLADPMPAGQALVATVEGERAEQGNIWSLADGFKRSPSQQIEYDAKIEADRLMSEAEGYNMDWEPQAYVEGSP